MKNAPMRFDGLSLRHNPATLTVSGRNYVREYASPCCEADSDSLYREPARISGEGEFSGADCLDQYLALKEKQLSQTPGKLVLPGMNPMYAVLKELSLTAKPVNSVISYRFTFVQAQSPRENTKGTASPHIARKGESLWDIAYANDVPIDRLVALNPQIPYINRLSKGERVNLC